MDSKIKKIAAGIALAGALTVGTAGAAFAADTSGSGTTTPSTQPAKGHAGIRAEIRKGAAKVISDTLGVSRADLRTALKSGQTISQYATSLQKDPQAVATALTNAADARIGQLVSSGKLSSTRAATIEQKLPARIDKLMNHQFGQKASA
jgi:hypothetical protein